MVMMSGSHRTTARQKRARCGRSRLSPHRRSTGSRWPRRSRQAFEYPRAGRAPLWNPRWVRRSRRRYCSRRRVDRSLQVIGEVRPGAGWPQPNTWSGDQVARMWLTPGSPVPNASRLRTIPLTESPPKLTRDRHAPGRRSASAGIATGAVIGERSLSAVSTASEPEFTKNTPVQPGRQDTASSPARRSHRGERTGTGGRSQGGAIGLIRPRRSRPPWPAARRRARRRHRATGVRRRRRSAPLALTIGGVGGEGPVGSEGEPVMREIGLSMGAPFGSSRSLGLSLSLRRR